MQVAFATNKLAKLCNSARAMRGEFGQRCADKLAQRLQELSAAATLEDMRHLPAHGATS